MGDDGQERLRTVVREAVRVSRRPGRELERAIGLGSGKLARLLDGRLEIRLHHLVGLAAVLSVPPADFLELGFPEATGRAKHRLRDWFQPVAAGPPAAAASANAASLAEVVRDAVREELARQQPAAK